MEYTANHIPEQNRYDVDLGVGHTAFLTYSDRDGVRYIMHTEVPAELRGGGYGKVLMEAALTKMAEEKVIVSAVCSYARIYIERHKEWHHLRAA